MQEFGVKCRFPMFPELQVAGEPSSHPLVTTNSAYDATVMSRGYSCLARGQKGKDPHGAPSQLL